MNKIAYLFMVLLMLCISYTGHTSTLFPFETSHQEQRFHQLLQEIRCPQCQNQALSESFSAIAEDLKVTIYQQIIKGKDDQTIRDFMVYRYGPSILYTTPFNMKTCWLWLLPIFLLIAGLGIIIRHALYRSKRTSSRRERT